MANLINFPLSPTINPGGKCKAGIIKTNEMPAEQDKIIIAVSQETLDNLSASRLQKQKPSGLYNDDVIEIGPTQSFVFPPSNAPKAVKRAWDKATSGLTDQQKAFVKTAFLELQLKANTHMTPEGEVKIVSPEKPEYRNVFANNSSEDYLNLIDNAINILEVSSKYYNANEKEDIGDELTILKVFKNILLCMISNPRHC